jgi:ribosomal protein S18 acetylase RimI-like enzyme
LSAPRIRAALPADAHAIARVHVQAWLETYRGLVPDAMLDALSVDRNAGMWEAALGHEQLGHEQHGVVQVAETEAGIVGFGSAGKTRDAKLGTSGEVSSIYLLDHSKRRGIGRTLFGSLLRALAERGHTSVGLWVLVANAPTRRFYEALGGRIGPERIRQNDLGDLNEIAYLWDDLARFAATRLP